jgi:hypothetical protein
MVVVTMKIYVDTCATNIKTMLPGDLFLSKEHKYLILCLKKQVLDRKIVITWLYQSDQFSTEIYDSNYANTI